MRIGNQQLKQQISWKDQISSNWPSYLNRPNGSLWADQKHSKTNKKNKTKILLVKQATKLHYSRFSKLFMEKWRNKKMGHIAVWGTKVAAPLVEPCDLQGKISWANKLKSEKHGQNQETSTKGPLREPNFN